MPKYTQDLKLISGEDQDFAGQIFSRYSLLQKSGLKIADGFLISFEAFEKNFEQILPEIQTLFSNTLSDSEKNKAIERLLLPKLKIQSDLKSEIQKRLSFLKPPFQIKAVMKDTDERESISFDMVVKNTAEVPSAIVSAWSSFIKMSPQISKKNLVSIFVAEKTLPDVSGKVFALGGESGKIEIEAQWGEFRPTEKSDIVTLNLKTLDEQTYLINPQRYQLVYKNGRYEALKVTEKFHNVRKITPDQVEKIASAIKKLLSLVGTSLEVNFEICENKILLDNLSLNIEKGNQKVSSITNINLPALSDFKPLVPGIISGFARSVKSSTDLKKIRSGDIAVVENFRKDYLPSLKKASAIVVENSKLIGKQVLPQIKSLGVTAVEGSLKIIPKQVLTINGKTGKIYLGAFAPSASSKLEVQNQPATQIVTKTATKIFLQLSSLVTDTINLGNFDGVGPIRPELFFTRFGIHPQALLNKNDFNKISNDLENYLLTIANNIPEKTVIYQISDFKTNDLIHLSQGELYETPETNPFLGSRGLSRHLVNPMTIKAELGLVKHLRNSKGLKNLSVSLPFIRTVEELLKVKKIITQVGLNRSPSFKVFLTVSTPANIFSIEQFIAAGIDGILIDYYDLANLTYGKDFSYSELANLKDGALLNEIKILLKTVNKSRLFSLISNFPEEVAPKLFPDLVETGLKAVSVPLKHLDDTRNSLYQAEKSVVTRNKD